MASPTINFNSAHAANALRSRWAVQSYKSSALRALLHVEPVLQWFNEQHQTCKIFVCRALSLSLRNNHN
jgi:hypothetical protein